MPSGSRIKVAVIGIWVTALVLLAGALATRGGGDGGGAHGTEAVSPAVAECVGEIRRGAASMSGLLAPGESVDDVDDAAIERICREQVLPAREAARSTSTSSAPIAVSAGCAQGMANAAAEPDSTAAQPLIDATLSHCSNAHEWLAALRLHPAAMGVADPAFISEQDLQIACSGEAVAETSVCVDARERGLL